MNNEKYVERINRLASEISVDIIDLDAKRTRGKAPTIAFSSFITNSQQGNWAEGVVQKAINSSLSDHLAIQYGKSDDIVAGDPGFSEFYEEYQNELDEIGKRPDILLFDNDVFDSSLGKNISGFSKDELNKLVPKATAGFEVRSSSYLAEKFKSKKYKPTLSFTPKTEDLKVILRWINIFEVPHYFIQVFFDSVYLIPFEHILKILGSSRLETSGRKKKKVRGYSDGELLFEVQENPKNQFKTTIHVFLNNGYLISKKVEMPNLVGKRKELKRGRLLHYVGFEKGKIELNVEQFVKAVLG